MQPLDALRSWGATPEIIEEWRKVLLEQASQSVVNVWPEHWHAVMLFLAMSTQWRGLWCETGVRWLGLDYSPLRFVEHSVKRGMVRSLRRPWRVVFDQLQVLERQATLSRNKVGN